MILDQDPEIWQGTFHCSTSLGGNKFSEPEASASIVTETGPAQARTAPSLPPAPEHFFIMPQWGCLNRSSRSSAVEVSQPQSVLRGRQPTGFLGIQRLFQIQLAFWRKAFQPCKLQTKLTGLCRISLQFLSERFRQIYSPEHRVCMGKQRLLDRQNLLLKQLIKATKADQLWGMQNHLHKTERRAGHSKASAFSNWILNLIKDSTSSWTTHLAYILTQLHLQQCHCYPLSSAFYAALKVSEEIPSCTLFSKAWTNLMERLVPSDQSLQTEHLIVSGRRLEPTSPGPQSLFSHFKLHPSICTHW